MGEAPIGLTLERKNNDLGYTPDNCTWTTVRDQLNNQRRNVVIEYEGRSLTLGQWATELGIHYDTLWRRHTRSLSIPQVLSVKTLKEGKRAHGTRSGYDGGCRCTECKAFNATRARAREQRSRGDA